MTKSGKVGTYGGIKLPTVTIFMDGFLAGVQQYNKDNSHQRRGARLGRHDGPVHR